MTREAIPLYIDDLSDFARHLARELPDTMPHQSWLNLLARAGGKKNWQHLRASHGITDPEPAPDLNQVKRALRHFDEAGRMTRIPTRRGMQILAVWAIWARLPKGTPLSERALSARIDALCCFHDAAQIRRTLIEAGLMTRTLDGSRYDRVEQAPPPEARALIARLRDPRSAFL